jgi:hypothetical protein
MRSVSACVTLPIRAVAAIACLFSLLLVPRPAAAQGALTNGGAHAGVISSSGEIDTWTFTAALGDSISLSVGEVLPGGPDPAFVPWIRLQRPDGVQIGSAVGNVSAQIYVNAPLSGTYTVLVRDSTINRPGTSTGSYLLHYVKAPGTITTTDSGALTSGGNHPGSIYVGDLDAWTFDAAQNDYIALSVGEVLTSQIDPFFIPYLRLIGPNGQQVTWSVGTAAAVINVNAPLSGTYTVLVADSNINREASSQGDYILHFIKVPGNNATVPSGDDGGVLTNGGNHRGRIGAVAGQPIEHDRADLDVWTFQAAQNDHIVLSVGEVVTTEIDPTFIPYLRLIGPNGALVGWDVGLLSPKLDVLAPLSGTYTVIISDSNINREPSSNGDYIVHLVKVPGGANPLVVPAGDEGGPMTNGANHLGRIGAITTEPSIDLDPGDVDAWTFTANQNDYIALSVGEVLIAETDPNFIPYIRLIGPTGALVAWNVGVLAAKIDVNAPLSGTYTVVIADSNINREGNHTGDYILRLVKVPGNDLVVPPGDQGGAIANGLNYLGDIGPGPTLPNRYDPGDMDPYTFTAAQGASISVSVGEVMTSEIDPLFLPYIRLIGPNGALVTWDAGNSEAHLTATAPLTGIYTVIVSDVHINNEGNHTGRYLLTIAVTPGAFQVPPGDEGGVMATGGTANPGIIHRGDIDQWTFNAVAGSTITVTATEVVPGGGGVDPEFTPWIRLRAPNGQQVGTSAGVTTATMVHHPIASGLYTVLVSDWNRDRASWVAGVYNLSVTITVPSYTVFSTAGANGTINPSGSQSVPAGETRSFTVTPNANYLINSVTGCGGSLAGSIYTTGPIAAACTVTATFMPRPLPTTSLDRTTLRFGATKSGAVFVTQTAPQIVRLRQNGTGTVTWTATPSQPWLQVSPASGTGSADITVSVSATGTPSSGAVSGSITFAMTGSANNPGTISTVLTVIPSNSSAAPFGIVDTPTDNRTGVTGAVPFTGWALDDIQVSRIMVCRSPFGSEVVPANPNCGGAAQIFLGLGVNVEGARPDVAAAFPSYPANTAGGWGFMVLTNMLPNQGNGTYGFHVYVEDREGHTTLIGSKTMSCANAQATLPFGAIDTPGQGGVASGNSYVNFGWALTPQPKSIPLDGSTITVLVDGVAAGTATYNNFRTDIATLFPGYANSGGAVGFRVLDTTTLANGTHTIVWIVTDSAGATEGIGSRYFTVSNGASAVTAAATAAAPLLTLADVNRLPQSTAPVPGRRGWDLETPLGLLAVNGAGRIVLRGEEIDRFELGFANSGATTLTGYLRTGDGLAALPIGSTLDAATGTFVWSPGVGFIGNYDLVFVRWDGASPVERHDVRVVVQPKGRGSVGPQVVIDVPTARQSDVTQPFMLAGWALDLGAERGSGIDTVHVWAYPVAGGAPTFAGVAEVGGKRPDVAAVHGDQFLESSYGLIVNALTPGEYDLAVFAYSTVTGGFVPAKVVRVTVK